MMEIDLAATLYEQTASERISKCGQALDSERRRVRDLVHRAFPGYAPFLRKDDSRDLVLPIRLNLDKRAVNLLAQQMCLAEAMAALERDEDIEYLSEFAKRPRPNYTETYFISAMFNAYRMQKALSGALGDLTHAEFQFIVYGVRPAFDGLKRSFLNELNIDEARFPKEL